MPDVEITAYCDPHAETHQILLPRSTVIPKGKRLLVKGSATAMLMTPGTRSDHGNAACVSGADLLRLGGDGATVSYRGAGLLGCVRRDFSLLLKFVLAALTAVGAVLSAVASFVSASSSAAGSYANRTAAILFIIAAVVAIGCFVEAYQSL